MSEQATVGAHQGHDSVQSTLIGVVESDKRDKTRKVVVQYLSKHPKYGKYIRQKTTVHAHDENNESKRGDRVEVTRCNPMSKTKRWKLVRVVDAAPGS